ncbi:MAG: serine acetyltransferase [Chitinophagaceae bacterium]|nr:serine acetyltransferase [Chitinophagaceae bacterium]
MSLSALRSDTIRKNGVYKKRYLLKGYLFDRTFRPLITLRLCQATGKAGYPGKLAHVFFRVLHRWACHSAGIDLPWTTSIAPGFIIVHGWGIVVNGRAVIGRNVTFFHGVTLGQRDRIAKDGTRTVGYPVIEDEVWVGPHAVIVGGLVIGRGSRIAAGAFVTESIPPYSVVAGNPAAIVKSGATPDVYNPAP